VDDSLLGATSGTNGDRLHCAIDIKLSHPSITIAGTPQQSRCYDLVIYEDSGEVGGRFNYTQERDYARTVGSIA
jgi:hypothetical protein